MTVALAPVLRTASATVSNTVKPSWTRPPLPGVTPPTTLVPYSRICLAWKVPAEPVMPWTMSFVCLPTRTDMWLFPFRTLRGFRTSRDGYGRAKPALRQRARLPGRERDHLAGAVGHV